MDIKDDEMDKLEQVGNSMREQFKSITGVKVSNWVNKVESSIVRLQRLKVR